MTKSRFTDQVAQRLDGLRPAEQRVARFLADNREEALIGSASYLAEKAGTSDATVIRAVKALGFSGMEELRRTLAGEMRDNPSPFNRLARTLNEIGDDVGAALDVTIDIHQQSLEQLRRDLSAETFTEVIRHIVGAQRVFIFGIGPSSAMAQYFSIQLNRFGIEASSLDHSGILLADQMLPIKKGDLLLVFAYGRIYPELAALLDYAKTSESSSILFSDTLGGKLRDKVDIAVAVPRGRSDLLSMHTTTLGLIEALLVGVAIKAPERAMHSLKTLNDLRASLAGKRMDLPAA